MLARFLRATAEGNYLALADPARAKQVLAKGTRVADPKIVEITYADFTQMTPLDLSVPRAGAENILAHFPQGGEPQSRRLYRPVDPRRPAQGGPLCRTRKEVREAVSLIRAVETAMINQAAAIGTVVLRAPAWRRCCNHRRPAAQSVEEFYKGRAINLIIGGGAGGGYDVYYRALARHMGKHIPGNPTFIPKNQPAAGGLAAASAIYTTADRDGGTIGAFANNVTMDPLFGAPGARYDPLKLNWIGSIGKLQNVCATWHASPIKTIAAGDRARGDRRRGRRDLQHRADAEGAQFAARHQIPRDLRLRSRPPA